MEILSVTGPDALWAGRGSAKREKAPDRKNPTTDKKQVSGCEGGFVCVSVSGELMNNNKKSGAKIKKETGK